MTLRDYFTKMEGKRVLIQLKDEGELEGECVKAHEEFLVLAHTEQNVTRIPYSHIALF